MLSSQAPAAAKPPSAAAVACAQVFSFPRSRAAITTPRSIAASRRPEIRSSRATIAATIHAGQTPSSISITSTARTSTLSAIGSSSEPSCEVTPRLRAIRPSSQSVAIATQKMAVAQYSLFGKSHAYRSTTRGTDAARATVS